MDKDSYMSIPNWDTEALEFIAEEKIDFAIKFYEEKIESGYATIDDYFYLGLAYLLDTQEDMAQLTWYTAITEGELPEAEAYKRLAYTLEKEVYRITENDNKIELEFAIRQYIKEIDPQNIKNKLELISLSVKLKIFTDELLEELNIYDTLEKIQDTTELTESYIERFINNYLSNDSRNLEIISLFSRYFEDKLKFVNILFSKIQAIKPKNPSYAGSIAKLCTTLLPENLLILHTTYWCYSVTNNYREAIDTAKQFYAKCKSPIWKLVALYAVIREKTRGGEWEDIDKVYDEYKALMYELVRNNFSEEEFLLKMAVSVIPCMLQYYQDNPTENRYLQNKLSEIFQEKVIADFKDKIDPKLSKVEIPFKFNKPQVLDSQKIKVGFLVSKLSLHSVGWLSRWLFQHYNHEKFEYNIYVIKQSPGDVFTRTWFESKVDKCVYFDDKGFENIAQSIYLDDINILIDLDSTTSCEACYILSFKPAPIQATWLGFDSSGLPSIDYFIVDNYLLPSDADNYYSEKLWRLPNTYLAIDGFEIEVPTLTRQNLGISEDSIIYLSSQTGQKRNPNTIRLQLNILKNVPNSFLIIKGWGEMKVIEDLFKKLAVEEQIDSERLKFLPLDENEFVHRANLQIADVILDTYPYNGATTTLEALWVGVPIVTRVGKQCAARNSYTFLANVGISDGIAQTDEEYVSWGVRFGLELNLRRKVSHQLRRSRHTSCIWDTKQFAKDMEEAFEEMWKIYTQE